MRIVVTPAQNEAETISHIVAEIRQLGLASIVVDDASTDRTGELAREAGAVVVRLDQSFGVGHALRRGFAHAQALGATEVVQCDGDGQHPVGEIPAMFASHPDALLVVGSRFLGASSLQLSVAKRLGITLLRVRLRTKVNLRLSDPTSGFRCIRGPLLAAFAEDFPSRYLGDTFEACLAAAELVGPGRIAEVGVTMRDRQGGVPFARGGKAAWLLIRAIVGTATPFRKALRPLTNLDDTPPGGV